MLKKETIKELKKILEEDYKQDISIQETSDVANTLVIYFDLLAKIYYHNKIKKKETLKNKFDI